MRRLIFFCPIVASVLFFFYSAWVVTAHIKTTTHNIDSMEQMLTTVASGQGGVRNPHCPFLVGVDMPAGKYPTKQTLYFVPAYRKAPTCWIDFGEGQLIDVKPEWIRFAGKPETRVDIRCRETE